MMGTAARRWPAQAGPPAPGAGRPPAQAWRSVRREHEGRLLYPTPHGERSLIVTYRAGAQGLTLHLPSFVEAVNYLDGQPVALEVAERDTPPARVEGTAEVVADDAVSEADVEQLEQWPPGILSHFVVIRVPEAVKWATDGE